jgi:thiamine pyrophosphate-dependent acetolactate synthase large subunit-like protein
MVGMHGTRAANMALHETDLLLVFGARLDDRVTGDPTQFAPHAKIVHFEIDPAQLDRVRAVRVAGDRQSCGDDSRISQSCERAPARLERLARGGLRTRAGGT